MRVRDFYDAVSSLTARTGVTRCDVVGSSLLGEEFKAQDIDLLVQIDTSFVVPATWSRDGASDVPSPFESYREGEVNYILADCADWYDRMKMASDLAAELRLYNKRDRILLHRVVRDGMTVDEAKVNLP